MPFLGLCPRKQGCYPWDSGHWGNQATRVNCAGCRSPPVLSDAKNGFERNSLSLWHGRESSWTAQSEKLPPSPNPAFTGTSCLVQENLKLFNLNYNMYWYGVNSNVLLEKKRKKKKHEKEKQILLGNEVLPGGPVEPESFGPSVYSAYCIELWSLMFWVSFTKN